MANKDFTLPANSDLTEQTNASEETPTTKQYIAYVGKGSEKILTERDFHENGIHNQKAVRWHNGNGYQVPVDPLSADALAFILTQPTVTLTEVDADGTSV